jgi:hypothetical protein
MSPRVIEPTLGDPAPPAEHGRRRTDARAAR